MYKIRFIWVGKCQSGYAKQGVEEWIGKIKPFVKVEVLELKAASGKNVSKDDCRRRETDDVLAKLHANETRVILDETGKSWRSVEMAKWLDGRKIEEHGRVNFVIGGAFGLELDRLKPAQMLSLSAMTFNHQIVRLMLLEQVYRAFTIIEGMPYHHE